MRDNPMCATCVHLDMIDADPTQPCPECQERQEKPELSQPAKTKLGAAVDRARGWNVPPSMPLIFD